VPRKNLFHNKKAPIRAGGGGHKGVRKTFQGASEGAETVCRWQYETPLSPGRTLIKVTWTKKEADCEGAAKGSINSKGSGEVEGIFSRRKRESGCNRKTGGRGKQADVHVNEAPSETRGTTGRVIKDEQSW